MKYLLSFALISIFMVSCTKDNETTDTSAALTAQVLLEDNSNIGEYQAVLSTVDSKTRASVLITIPDGSNASLRGAAYPSAIITFESGKQLLLNSNEVQFPNTITLLNFSNERISFEFYVDADGNNEAITDLTINATVAKAIIAKNTSRAPVTPLMGTYVCTDCGTHPTLNSGIVQTFNNLVITPADGSAATLMSQIFYGTIAYSGSGSQANCVDDTALTTCDINGTLNTPNMPATFTGSHIFNNEDTAAGNDCSQVNGTWEWVSGVFGTLSGTFVSDNVCIIEVTLIDESFETPMTIGYVPNPVDDMTGGMFDDYYGIVAPGAVAADIVINNIDGLNYYGAQDTNGAGIPTNDISLTWSGLDISGLSEIDFSGYFAEDTANDGNNDWDSTSSVRMEYAIDGGAWIPVIAFEAELVNPGDFSNEFARLDTDFDGLGDGTILTDTLQNFTASATVSGNLMNVRVFIIGLNDGDEDVAIDNIVVTGM